MPRFLSWWRRPDASDAASRNSLALTLKKHSKFEITIINKLSEAKDEEKKYEAFVVPSSIKPPTISRRLLAIECSTLPIKWTINGFCCRCWCSNEEEEKNWSFSNFITCYFVFDSPMAMPNNFISFCPDVCDAMKSTATMASGEGRKSICYGWVDVSFAHWFLRESHVWFLLFLKWSQLMGIYANFVFLCNSGAFTSFGQNELWQLYSRRIRIRFDTTFRFASMIVPIEMSHQSHVRCVMPSACIARLGAHKVQ